MLNAYNKPAKAKRPPAMAPIAGRAVGAAMPELWAEAAELAADAALEARELASLLMEEEAAPSVALERAAEADEAMLDASLAAELAADEAAESAPEAAEEATELAPETAEEMTDPAPPVAEAPAEPAAEVRLLMTDVTSFPMPEVAPPTMEDTTESIWALAAPAAAAATKMAEKRIVACVGV